MCDEPLSVYYSAFFLFGKTNVSQERKVNKRNHLCIFFVLQSVPVVMSKNLLTNMIAFSVI